MMIDAGLLCGEKVLHINDSTVAVVFDNFHAGAETPEELLAATTRYQNLALIAARGNAMNQTSRVSAMIAAKRSGVAV